uniref:SNF2 domain-containing protein CLASSY 4-like n=1 Tax=Tanacetum cinerariifolium TaxID=118510 RepID=A0A6L2NQ36_TANCI|nr:SNF2 domain-containing protein CLASSY 4-like [Tanacetum cinerariifolium]
MDTTREAAKVVALMLAKRWLRSETGNRNAQPAKKANTNAAVGVQTRSKAASQGSQLTTSGTNDDGGGTDKNNVGPRKTKKVKKKGKNVEEPVTRVKRGRPIKRGKKMSLVDESDLEVSKSFERTCAKKGKTIKRRKGVRRNDAKEDSGDDVISEHDDCSGNAEKDPETVPVKRTNGAKGKCLKRKRGVGGKFVTDVRMSSRGFGVNDSDDDDGVIFLGDDITCLDDYDPSHSSRVESNEVKASPVELDSIQADAVDGDGDESQGLKSSEKKVHDSPKFKSPIENDSDSDWKDLGPSDNDIIYYSVSSSSDREDGKDGNAVADANDKRSAINVKGKSRTDLGRKHTSDDVHEEENIDQIFFDLLQRKPVEKRGKKKAKVDFFEPGVSKKDHSNENEKSKSDESGLEKRQINKDFLVVRDRKVNKVNKDDFWQIVDEKVTQKDGKIPPSNKYDKFGNKIDVAKILTDAMLKDKGVDEVLQKYVPAENISSEEIPVEKTPVEKIVSYKFKFDDEDEEDKMPEKLEYETEVVGLFDEMRLCLQSSEIGSSGASMANRGYADFLVDGKDQATCCRGGKHHLTINDEFGIICKYCSFVEIEIRDILPPLCKNGRGGHGRHDIDKSDRMKFSDFKLTDCNQEHLHAANGSQYEKGTVWDLVPGVKNSMYPHQREGFEFIWKKIAGGTYIDKLEKRLPAGGSGCIISHAPGTEEFKKWNVDFPFHNLNNNECSGQEHKVASQISKNSGNGKSALCTRLLKLFSWKQEPSVLGITYRLFESLAGEEGKRKKTVNYEDENIKKILLQAPSLVVLDEGHTPRNDQSLMWKALLNLKTKRSIILSGTPFQNNFDELYNTLSLVNPLLSFGISSFRNDEFSKKRGWKNLSAKGQWDSITSSVRKCPQKLTELKAMVDPFVHVHKGTILQEKLLGLKDALVVLKPTKTQHSLLGRLSGTKSSLGIDHLMSLVSVHPSLLPEHPSYSDQFYKVLKVFEKDARAGIKTQFLMELLKLSEALGEKVLVFSQYIRPLEFIMQLIKTDFKWVEGIECLYMDGQQDEKVRQNSINTFNNPKSEAKVLLASLKACSEGINLVGASRVVLLDVHWNPSVERQAISRAYRLGQKKVVYVYHLVTGSMEGEKYVRQVEKSHLSELVFSSKNKDSSNPTISSTVSVDKILEEMVQHEKLQNMFEKVIYQPKEADLIETFG